MSWLSFAVGVINILYYNYQYTIIIVVLDILFPVGKRDKGVVKKHNTGGEIGFHDFSSFTKFSFFLTVLVLRIVAISAYFFFGPISDMRMSK